MHHIDRHQHRDLSYLRCQRIPIFWTVMGCCRTIEQMRVITRCCLEQVNHLIAERFELISFGFSCPSMNRHGILGVQLHPISSSSDNPMQNASASDYEGIDPHPPPQWFETCFANSTRIKEHPGFRDHFFNRKSGRGSWSNALISQNRKSNRTNHWKKVDFRGAPKSPASLTWSHRYASETLKLAQHFFSNFVEGLWIWSSVFRTRFRFLRNRSTCSFWKLSKTFTVPQAKPATRVKAAVKSFSQKTFSTVFWACHFAPELVVALRDFLSP